MSPIYKSNKMVAISYSLFAIIILIILLVSHNYLTDLLESWNLHKCDSNSYASVKDLRFRYHNVVMFSGLGIILFSMLSAIRNWLLSSKINAPHFQTYGSLVFEMLLWGVVLVFGDIVYQNWGDKATTLSIFTMRPNAIGGLIGIEVIFLHDFFRNNRKNQ
jgi:hypothetical protein